MGRDIESHRFRQQDFHQFERRMASEMALLHEYFRLGRFADRERLVGMELEVWLLDSQGRPAPRNEEFLQRMDSPLVVPELSRFNIEFNVSHQPLTGAGLHRMRSELAETWAKSQQVAREIDLRLAMIGILPTVQEQHLCVDSMSERSRYRALNEQVLRLRRGRPLHVRIAGEETLDVLHHDVMLEAAATSLQVHLQVPAAEAKRYYNAAVIASPAVVALTANSPVLFGKLLWEESRLPVFEQAVDLGGPFPRVGLGSGYVSETLEELFLENRSCHPVLLPMEIDEPVEMLPHVRLHNGTIWRWNRPLIGFDETGRPHLRIEHRVMPAGPTLPDMAANIAFACGLIHALAVMDVPPEEMLPFPHVETNFLAAARTGLAAQIRWLEGQSSTVQTLLAEELLTLAGEGLLLLGIPQPEVTSTLQLLAARVASGQTGAAWQRAFLNKHGRDMHRLTRAYLERQESNEPVHLWSL